MNDLKRLAVSIVFLFQFAFAQTVLGATNELKIGETLQPDQYLNSPNNQYQLRMQTDGNLVFTNLSNGAVLWASNTQGIPNLRAVMQGDGNFILYNPSNVAYWASNTNPTGGATLTVQDDGNLVIYGRAVTFSSNTPIGVCSGAAADYSLLPGFKLVAAGTLTVPDGSVFGGVSSNHDRLISGNGCYQAVMQGDGNLVVYRVSDQAVLWATNTQGSGATTAIMQADGNLVLFRSNLSVVWASNTNAVEHRMSSLVMQSDGNLVIYTARKPVWVLGHKIQDSTCWGWSLQWKNIWKSWQPTPGISKPGPCT